ncbi:hypothetical protein OIU34_27995 [Pararhizobium sp. BT-229]|uniref:hypothetical protein n=1 Tax=Pararhizobium sp. BT-229 TaxID=2986923 RepID=UPI0021F7B25C|nr:hypothetical protein [Pararhizobium sp. BT-229]MCV9965717.1 hypothetical protein [Pararhizobium sp. BT-229]
MRKTRVVAGFGGWDGWLAKALIAAACVVVIAGGGYYAWKENGAANAAGAADKEATMMAACAKAEPADSGLPAMREHCKAKGYY